MCSTLIVESSWCHAILNKNYYTLLPVIFSLWGKWGWCEFSCLEDLRFHDNDDDNNIIKIIIVIMIIIIIFIQYYTWQLFQIYRGDIFRSFYPGSARIFHRSQIISEDVWKRSEEFRLTQKWEHEETVTFPTKIRESGESWSFTWTFLYWFQFL